MREVVASREVDGLSPTRVWRGSQKALRESSASLLQSAARERRARAHRSGDRCALRSTTTNPMRPEIDTGVHTLMVLDQTVRLSADARERFAALVHDLDKGTTPRRSWPRSSRTRGAHVAPSRPSPSAQDPQRLPRAHRHRRALRGRRRASSSSRAPCSSSSSAPARCAPERFDHVLLACEAGARGRLGLEDRPSPPRASDRRPRAAAAMKRAPRAVRPDRR